MLTASVSLRHPRAQSLFLTEKDKTVNKTMRPIEANDLFKLEFLQGGQWSPNGKYIVYSVSHIDAEAEKEYATLYLYTLDDGSSRPLTSGKYRDSLPQWSPDGSKIAFTSKRADKSQIYVMPIDGGEPRAITDIKQGVGAAPIWSPDGTQLAFTAGKDYGEKEPPDLSKDVYRLDRNVYRFDALGYLDYAIQNIYIVPAEGGEAKQLSDDDIMHGGLKWSPDGQHLLFTASMQPDSWCGFEPDVCLLNVKSGETQTLISRHDLSVFAPTWTPDGKSLVFGATHIGKDYPIGTKADLYVYELESKNLSNRSAGLHVGVGGGLSADMPTTVSRSLNILMPDDGQHAYIQVQDAGTVHVYRIALTGDEAWQAILTGERACFPKDYTATVFFLPRIA